MRKDQVCFEKCNTGTYTLLGLQVMGCRSIQLKTFAVLKNMLQIRCKWSDVITWVVLLVSLHSPWKIQKDSQENSFLDLFLHLWGEHGNDWKSTVGGFSICEAVPFWNQLIGEPWEHRPSELLVWNAIIFTVLENKLFKLNNFRAADDMKPWNI